MEITYFSNLMQAWHTFALEASHQAPYVIPQSTIQTINKQDHVKCH